MQCDAPAAGRIRRRGRRAWLCARSAAKAGAGAGLALLCACHSGAPRRSDAAGQADPGVDLGESRYAAPPQVLSASARPGGVIVLAGSASPSATLRLSAPEGEVFQVKTPPTGLWTLRVPPVFEPRMFALSASVDGRVVHGEGALLLAPRPAPIALLVRTGSGALVIDGAIPRPAILAADCDPGGVCALSGLARPGATVRLSLDGAPAGAGEADRDGRYAVLAASRRLQPGPHAAAVQTPGGAVRRPFTVSPPDPLRTPYQVAPTPEGWRVEWAIPGGGVQTTQVFAAR